ncbi:uncharacterized protein LOC123675351 [Harmonia axyridis]|uniref:uncharacterized protein LOC123675351 n=1 Tax=Harmonia axyridis TaxID=115357 RepID=UPI001E2757EA|nr:uncharacterized protein LOC123675351 [Harmonia axyridis]
MSNTYFLFQDTFYKQVKGAPMGSPLSPAIANIYMDDFETNAIESFHLKPTCWLRYVDDVFVIWPHGPETLQDFFDHLNNINSHIKFTMEVETNNSLPFLDILVAKSNDSFTHTIYRKPTHTNRYLNANSHHHPSQINSVLNSLIHRSIKLTDSLHITQEINILQTALQQNGYNSQQVQKAINRHQTQTQQPKNPPENFPHKGFLPFIERVTDKISRILQKQDMKTVFTADNKISKFLRTPKDTIDNESQGVYEIPCSACSRTYIGQTKRQITNRVYEHQLAIRQGDPTSALFKHYSEMGHNVDFEGCKTISAEKTLTCRIIREALEIEKRPNCLNKRDDGQRLPNT